MKSGMVQTILIVLPVLWGVDLHATEIMLTPNDKGAGDYFGTAVAISGDYAIVGAGANSGSAYIFKREGSSWTQQAKLTADDGEEWDNFGVSVSISGDYALIGAPYDDDLSSDFGAAYLFKWDGTTWTQQAKLTGEQLRPRFLSNTRARDYFGGSVSISGDYVLVGAPDSDEAGYKSDSGAAYIFKIDGPVSVESEVDTQLNVVPSCFALFQNHPNPFNPLTTIAYDLPKAGRVTLTIYTITGKWVATLVSAYQEAGHHEVRWDGSGYANGVYLYRLEAEGFVKPRRMVLLK